MNGKHHSVSEVARLAGVTVRTLHHYDELGLLVPSARSEAGYRLYAAEDLERLHQILLLRELGMPLEGIRRTLDDPSYDRERALTEQRAMLEERVERLLQMLGGVEAALDALKGREPMSEREMFEGLGEFDSSEHEKEVEERWGSTDAYRVSARRTKSYTSEDWAVIEAEEQRLLEDLAALRGTGAPAGSEAAMALAERHRRHIDRWFYPCSHEMHSGLAGMYVADSRFTAHYDKHGEGLAEFFSEAILANGVRALSA
jgi:DNA-binding transcriptional MerR regulator